MKRALIAFLLFFTPTIAAAAPGVVNQVSILPTLTDTYDLGTTTKEWNGLYVKTICLSGDCKAAWPSGGGGGVWPFTPSSYNGVANQSTTSPLWLKNTMILASTTNFTNSSSTVATINKLFVTGLPNKILLTDITGQVGAYAGFDCSPSLVYAIDADGTQHCTSNAPTATQLATPRAINTVNFDGTAAITINAASSTALSDTNTWSGLQAFSNVGTTTHAGGITFTRFNQTATSTGSQGFNLTGGCFAIAGTCVGASGSSASSTLLIDTNTFSGNNVFTQPLDLTSTWIKTNGVTLGYASSTSGVTIFGTNAGGNTATTSPSITILTAFGRSALAANTTGQGNSAFGNTSLSKNTTGSSNTAAGYLSMLGNTTGSDNAAFGYLALSQNTVGGQNVAVGRDAGEAGAGAYWGDVFVGHQTAFNSSSVFASSTLIGYRAGYNNAGSNNIFLGALAGSNLTTGTGNVIIGTNIDAPSVSANGQLNIQNIIFGTGNTGTGGTLSSGNIGVGSASPQTTLQVSTSTIPSSIPAKGSLNGASLYMTSQNANYGTMFGSLNTGDSWEQVQRSDGTATAYNLLLQPNGGNIGVATTTPWGKVSIKAAGTTTGTSLLVTDSADATIFQLLDSGKLTLKDAVNNWTGTQTPTRFPALQTGTTTTWTATSSGPYIPRIVAPFAGTLRAVRCSTDLSFLGVELQINGADVTPKYFVASTTAGYIAITGSNTFVEGDVLSAKFGTTTTATATTVSCTPYTTQT